MVTEETWNIISRSNIFRGLTKSEFDIVSNHSSEINYQQNDIIVTENQKTVALYVILSGKVEVFLPKQSTVRRFSPIKLNVLSQGSFFGEYSLIDTEPASASVQAIEPSILFKITKNDFEKLVGSNDRIGKIIYNNLLKELIKRIRNKDKELDLFLA